MSAANGTQRDIGLDLTRILAFLAVPSVHFFLNSTYYDTAIVGPRMALMTVMRTAFMVCVPLYMLLSGYLCWGITKSFSPFSSPTPSPLGSSCCIGRYGWERSRPSSAP